MSIRQASASDLRTVRDIVHCTINTVYSRYYPKGAVEFFIAHHREENIDADIAAGMVFVIETGEVTFGTVTTKENEMCRLFVLPDYQRNGYGSTLVEFAERLIAKGHEKIRLDASLPAKAMYIKQGYSVVETHSVLTENGDCLVYDVMEKNL